MAFWQYVFTFQLWLSAIFLVGWLSMKANRMASEVPVFLWDWAKWKVCWSQEGMQMKWNNTVKESFSAILFMS